MKYFNKFKNWCIKDKRIFAEGLSLYKLYWVYIIGGIIGVYYEQILNGFFALHYDGIFKWELRRGVIFEPINPLYGVGALLLVYLLKRKNYTKLQTYIYGAFIGGLVEYIVSFLQDTFVGHTSWDYSEKLLNINGRTSIPYMLVWGLFALILVCYIYPKISDLIEKVPYNLGMLLTHISMIVMALDCFISWGALIRQYFRESGYHPFTWYGKFFDKYFPSDFLRTRYPNMRYMK